MTEHFKLIILPATKAGMTRAELHRYLEFNHGPLVMKFPDVSGGFTEYVHHYVESASTLRAGCDAVTNISFASVADLAASKASENYRLHVGPDEDNFRDEAESRAYSGVARVIRDGPRDAPCKLLGKPYSQSAGRGRVWCRTRRGQSHVAAGWPARL
jgi:hypothetical protein